MRNKLTAYVGATLFAIALVIGFVFLKSRGMTPVIEAELSGVYKSHWSMPKQGEETLLLKPDGTFGQEYTSTAGKRISNSGRWKVSRSDTYGVRAVRLNDYREFSIADDAALARLDINFGNRTNIEFSVERWSENEIVLFFGPDTGDGYVKQAGK